MPTLILTLRSGDFRRVSKGESPASWFETAQERLLTMRVIR
jgi:hypothetical protein